MSSFHYKSVLHAKLLSNQVDKAEAREPGLQHETVVNNLLSYALTGGSLSRSNPELLNSEKVELAAILKVHCSKYSSNVDQKARLIN